MDKYEYTVLSHYPTLDNPYLEQLLNKWGGNGWELCYLDNTMVIVKRMKPPSVESIGSPDEL